MNKINTNSYCLDCGREIKENMKKIILLFLVCVLVTGCFNKKEKELCDKIDEINVQSYMETQNYEELTSVLQKNYDNYCSNKTSDVCNALNTYINSSKAQVELEDCSTKQGSWKDLCESTNDVKIGNKKIDVLRNHEEVWAVCND